MAGKTMAQRPNVVLILLDDAHKFSIPPDGPDFLNYPSIARIYNEGVRFCNAYTPQPLCNPSRYSLFSGLYPHSSGVMTNESYPPEGLQTFWKITSNAGYHNQYIGKYSNVEDSLILGIEKSLLITKVDQKDPKMYLNGVKKIMNGQTTEIIDDSVNTWLAVIDTPFILGIGHIGTHIPLGVVNQYQFEYNGLGQVPDNFYAYSHDYPSFLYSDTNHFYTDSNQLKKNSETLFEIMQEIDRGVQIVFDRLEQRGLLENTLLIFTNDNGTFYGEHLLLGKMDPREPNTSIPLFIRYPDWFNAGTEICDNYVALYDLCPTILEVAGIDPAPYNLHGRSIKHLIQPGNERKAIYLEGIRTVDEAGAPPDYAPSWRAVRNEQFKFARYWCDTVTEELFDLQSDPQENNNLVNHPGYAPLVLNMRQLLDSLRAEVNDTITNDTIIHDCYLAFPAYNAVEQFLDEVGEMVVFPNPALDYMNILLPIQNGSLTSALDVFNSEGKKMFSINIEKGSNHQLLNVRSWPQGMYFARWASSEHSEVVPFLINR
jgi:N-acetylglucosamine-6-sulfatase